jgi:hypothetical protein
MFVPIRSLSQIGAWGLRLNLRVGPEHLEGQLSRRVAEFEHGVLTACAGGSSSKASAGASR